MLLLGLSLPQVLEQLGDSPSVVVETAPPFEPRHYKPIWGEKRVIRARELENGTWELVVARELLREDRSETSEVSKPPRAKR